MIWKFVVLTIIKFRKERCDLYITINVKKGRREIENKIFFILSNTDVRFLDLSTSETSTRTFRKCCPSHSCEKRGNYARDVFLGGGGRVTVW